MRKSRYVFSVLMVACILLEGIALAEDQFNRAKAAPTVLISTAEGTFDMKPSYGEFTSVTVPFVGYRRYVEFPSTVTSMVIRQPYPSLLVKTAGDPHDGWWLVKLKDWEAQKSLVVDLLSPTSWTGGATSDDPDETCNIPYAAINDKQGFWRITPKDQLQPGHYGLFRWATRNSTTALLYGFTVENISASQSAVPGTSVNEKNAETYENVKGIRLKNGKFIQGKIVSVENDIVKIRTKDNKIASYHFIKDVKEFVMK